jgi:hypothetical protein
MNIYGVPASHQERAYNELTVPGSFATSVNTRKTKMDKDLRDAAHSVAAAVWPSPMTISTDSNQYVQQMAANTYPGMNGLPGFEDAFPSLYPALNDISDEGMGDTNWADVAKTFVDEIGKGVGGKISGVNPWSATPKVTAPVTKPADNTVKYALIGGAVLFGGILLFKVLK